MHLLGGGERFRRRFVCRLTFASRQLRIGGPIQYDAEGCANGEFGDYGVSRAFDGQTGGVFVY